MKVGDLVKIKVDGLKDSKFTIEIEQAVCGIVVGFESSGWQHIETRDQNCDMWNDAIVLWPDFGIGYNMRAMLRVISDD